MLGFYGYVAVFVAGAMLSFLAVNHIRTQQVSSLKQEIATCSKESQRQALLLKQCEKDLQAYVSSYNNLVNEVKQKEMDYAKKLRTYAEEVKRLSIAQRYDIKVEATKDTCKNLTLILDRLVEVEK